MKLKQRPTVYHRLELLLRHSPKFAERMREMHEKMDEKNEEELVGGLADEFCLFEGIDDAQVREDVLFELGTHIGSNLKLYGTHNYRSNDAHYSPKVDLHYDAAEQVVVIEIKAPTTKAELLKHWWRIANEQRNFLQSGAPTDSLKIAKRMGSPDVKRLAELKKKQKGIKGLSESERGELVAIFWKLMTRDIFKESQKQQLDEDVFILRLSRDYGKDAELEYYRCKLIEWLKATKAENVNDDLSFQETCEKHCPDFMQLSFDEIRKVIRAKNFEQRLAQARMAFGLL